MVFEQIEKLKQQYTDKFVVVDESRPELRRFKGLTGTVRTVNMSGRALVEFDGNNNIGWYDIDLDYLKVIDAPLPKSEKPAKAAPEKAKKAPSELEKARGEKVAKPAGAKMSVEEMLAAARGGKGGAPAAKAKPAGDDKPAAPPKKAAADPSKMSVADILAAARGGKGGGATAEAAPAAPTKAPAKAAAKDAKSMSVAEMLAAARGEKGGASSATAAAPAPSPAPEPVEEEPVAEAESSVAVESSESAPAGDGKSQKGIITDIVEMVAYCRKVDG